MKNLIKTLPLGLVAMLLANCASVTRGSTDTLNITTNPSNATIVIQRTDRAFAKKELRKNQSMASADGATLTGTTPAVVLLKRAGDYEVTASKKGYKTSTARVSHKTATGGAVGMAGNVLLGGVIGGAVDVGTGATQNLTPNPLHIELDR